MVTLAVQLLSDSRAPAMSDAAPHADAVAGVTGVSGVAGVSGGDDTAEVKDWWGSDDEDDEDDGDLMAEGRNASLVLKEEEEEDRGVDAAGPDAEDSMLWEVRAPPCVQD